MTKFWVDDKGKLVQATDDSQNLSDSLTEVDVAPQSGKQDWNGSEWTDPNKVLVVKKRRSEYPDLQDQLDTIYWDKKNGTQNWVAIIDKVKSDNPK